MEDALAARGAIGLIHHPTALETDFTEGNGSARLTEEVLEGDGTGLAILAPHGGRIEDTSSWV